ncbi:MULTISPECIES: sugar ABC transporter substrate-binding protein [Micromonospora]|uniref:Sugar ABC transporter substrate-binding protein n=1 Tax=Micromonospora solifontis TaxID=2487138 RepID=A0ABX9WCM9_9ACTN|nr:MULTISPECIES: substrate-binding domain-containing protein [Micromonospora]NES12687.1 sugar ABC transporter substrate-binding protein [Micromonospora sp. PPF5-17B]NES38199.1 sugar ABC transporter substrate-binding protein [Micromonospora solifontis]NES54428.1 sugar ABC transporter substrate-binding protein [Micromonospora sp. PPF5-6]RNL96477.1 sugar ABC transporter substrate-binding protein [Micromonospora solifontis]
MRKGFLTFAAVGLLATGSMAACGDNGGSDQAGGSNDKKPKIGVILPDSKSSARWEGADRKFLEAAFKAANVDYDIQNAQGDKTQFQTIADQMITNGATVLMIVNLDDGTGKAVLDKAKSQGVGTIDYDRLTLGGSAQYYVSFDNEAVGKLQGEGLSKCLTDKAAKNPVVAYLNGSPTDNNATLFKNGYDSVLKPKFDSKEYVKGPDQAVPDWDNAQAATIFEQMLTQTNGKIDGVLAANDGLGNAAISVLKKNKLNGKVPVTGQDATPQGLQNILAGDQCMTVYKAVKKEADAAAELAIAVAKGEKKDTGQTVHDPKGNRDVPAVLLEPKAIYKDNVKDVVADGFVTKDELCTGEYAKLCADAGIS